MGQSRILVIVHGKSELTLCRHVRSGLRLPMEFDSEKKGEESIQIRGLPDRMSSRPYDSEASLHRKYPKLRYTGSGKDLRMPELRIFTIMDTDDSPNDRKSYIAGDLFRKVPLMDKITPIYNTPNLDAVMTECGYRINLNDKNGSYSELFEKREIEDVLCELHGRLRECGNTNLELFIETCMSLSPGFQ